MYIQQNEGRKYTHTQIVSSSKKECSEMESPNELDKSLMITTQRTKKMALYCSQFDWDSPN